MSNSREVAASIDGMNRNKKVPPLPPSLRSAAEAFSLYIFNVGPENWVRHVGTGTYYVKGRGNQRYSEPVKIPATVYTTVTGETGMRWEPSEGWDVANDILQTGRVSDMRRFGLFISETLIPRDEDVSAAEQARVDMLAARVQAADEAFQVNGGMVTVTVSGNSVTRSNITESDRAALKELGWSRPWASKNVQMAECWNCGRSVMPTSAKCFHEGCGAPLKNEAAKARFMAGDDEEPVKRGPGRPPKDS